MAEPVMRLRGFDASWSWRLEVNKPAPGWRGWLGLRLRMLATRIDGAHSLGVKIETRHDIGRMGEASVLCAGIEAMEIATRTLAIEAAVDAALITTYPELVDK